LEWDRLRCHESIELLGFAILFILPDLFFPGHWSSSNHLFLGDVSEKERE
jgi:hypothetical protein